MNKTSKKASCTDFSVKVICNVRSVLCNIELPGVLKKEHVEIPGVQLTKKRKLQG